MQITGVVIAEPLRCTDRPGIHRKPPFTSPCVCRDDSHGPSNSRSRPEFGASARNTVTVRLSWDQSSRLWSGHDVVRTEDRPHLSWPAGSSDVYDWQVGLTQRHYPAFRSPVEDLLGRIGEIIGEAPRPMNGNAKRPCVHELHATALVLSLRRCDLEDSAVLGAIARLLTDFQAEMAGRRGQMSERRDEAPQVLFHHLTVAA